MSKASYQTKQSRYIGLLNRGPYPKRWITLKVYRKWRRRRDHEARLNWRKGLDMRSMIGQNVEYWPPVEWVERTK